ncbi:MAG: MotA/TolQ/ExbB proton channel family protein [Chthoniobacteraceae bacterium]
MNLRILQRGHRDESPADLEDPNARNEFGPAATLATCEPLPYKRGMIDFMQKGGLLMWPIFFCSVLAGAIFLERVTFYHRISIRVGEFLRGLSNLIREHRFDEARNEADGTPGPVARVVAAALQRHQSPRGELKEVVHEAGQLEVPRLERRLGIPATVAFTAPLLGLLGTVLGLIDAFVNLSAQSGYTSSTDLASGIYQALLATAGGLIVTIPSAVAYGYLNARINGLLHDMERAGIEIVNLICDQRGKSPEIIDFPPATATATRQRNNP